MLLWHGKSNVHAEIDKSWEAESCEHERSSLERSCSVLLTRGVVYSGNLTNISAMEATVIVENNPLSADSPSCQRNAEITAR